jgi:hypothetical protein
LEYHQGASIRYESENILYQDFLPGLDSRSSFQPGIPKRRLNKQTVQKALTENRWALDIQGAITVGSLLNTCSCGKYFKQCRYNMEYMGVQDIHLWRFTENRKYAAKVTYEGLFGGSVQFEPYERIWKSWAPPKCRYFAWLIAQHKCWTADRLARHGLDHLENAPYVTKWRKPCITSC